MSKSTTAATTTSTEIPLSRLSSANYGPSLFSTTSTLPPSYASSLASTSQFLLPTTPFIPTAILQIQSAGKAMISLPLSTNELCIPIFSCDREGKTERPKWLSIRPSRKSGSCYLVDAEDESQTSIARTTYRFGPGRHPMVHIGKDPVSKDAAPGIEVSDNAETDTSAETGNIAQDGANFQMIGKHLLSRAVCFSSPRWGTFEWRYCNRKERATASSTSSPPNSLLVLDKILKGDNGKEASRIRVAQLVRSEEARTPGSKASAAGNGGRLELCLSGDGAGDKLVDEVTVVVTVMIMLKKEIDRLRAAQIAVLSAGASGGP